MARLAKIAEPAFPIAVTTDDSIWSSLRHPTYLRVWSALVVSGCCVSAHEMAATWAMNSLGAPILWLSLMSSAATLPFFLFTLPAGALADLADRRRLLRISNGWLACSAGLLACCAFLGGLTPAVTLAGVFLLGTGFAFQAPVASASIPEIVGKEQPRDEHALCSELRSLHAGQALPPAKHYLGIQHWIPEESATSRLKPVPTPTPRGDRPAAKS